jgi:hypothetical protein
MISVEVQDAFYAGKRGDLVKFVINDSVQVTSGEHEGCKGAIISIEEVEPEVVYLVERGDDGSSIYVAQKHLKLLSTQPESIKRQRSLLDLIEFSRKPVEMHSVLAEYDWDFEEELVQLERHHVVAVLRLFIAGTISSEEVEDWANLIECRDDVGYEEVAEVLHVLANPTITHELTRKAAASLIDELMEHNTPLEPSR